MDPSQTDPGKWFSSNITYLDHDTLDFFPSCVEFVEGRNDYFVVGTYALEKNDNAEAEASNPEGPTVQLHYGSLSLYKTDGKRMELLKRNILDYGVYDLAFLPQSYPPVFAAALTGGYIATVQIAGRSDDELAMKTLDTQAFFDLGDIVTSIAWYPYKTDLYPPLLAATSQNGLVRLIRFDNWSCMNAKVVEPTALLPKHFIKVDRVKAVNAWCCAWSATRSGSGRPGHPGSSTLFSGGDDALKTTYLDPTPLIPLSAITLSPLNVTAETLNPRNNEGVVAILPLPVTGSDFEHVVLTGGYGNCVRLTFLGAQRRILAELNVGEGIYKLKLLKQFKIPFDFWGDHDFRVEVLASCCNAGARILEVRGLNGVWSINVIGSVTIHRSLCYGSAVQPLSPKEENSEHVDRIFVSTSHYDRLMSLWTCDPMDIADTLSEYRPSTDLVPKAYVRNVNLDNGTFELCPEMEMDNMTSRSSTTLTPGGAGIPDTNTVPTPAAESTISDGSNGLTTDKEVFFAQDRSKQDDLMPGIEDDECISPLKNSPILAPSIQLLQIKEDEDAGESVDEMTAWFNEL